MFYFWTMKSIINKPKLGRFSSSAPDKRAAEATPDFFWKTMSKILYESTLILHIHSVDLIHFKFIDKNTVMSTCQMIIIIIITTISILFCFRHADKSKTSWHFHYCFIPQWDNSEKMYDNFTSVYCQVRQLKKICDIIISI